MYKDTHSNPNTVRVGDFRILGLNNRKNTSSYHCRTDILLSRLRGLSRRDQTEGHRAGVKAQGCGKHFLNSSDNHRTARNLWQDDEWVTKERREKIPRIKSKWQHNMQKPMGYKESSPKRSDYSPSSHTEKPESWRQHHSESTHTGQLTTAYNSSSVDPTLSPGFCQHCAEMTKMRAEVKQKEKNTADQWNKELIPLTSEKPLVTLSNNRTQL